jgi:hypothetical protein
MKMSNDPSPEMKRKILASWGGIFPFTSDPPVLHGQEHKEALGFWLRTKDGQVTKVAGKDWSVAYPLATSGRIVIGLGEVEGNVCAPRTVANIPDVITEALAPELPESGWAIGIFGHGRYVADNGAVFNNRSIVVVLAGSTTEKLKRVARLLARRLDQECVLVFVDTCGEIWLIGQDEPAAPEIG